jgi:hypothetical protein
MTTRTLTTAALAACATGIGYLAACVARLPQQPVVDEHVHIDELALRRRERAMALHPAFASNVVPFPTPDQAS